MPQLLLNCVKAQKKYTAAGVCVTVNQMVSHNYLPVPSVEVVVVVQGHLQVEVEVQAAVVPLHLVQLLELTSRR